ncbi:unnamed protein product [Eruca vesicaria subsp. sativa]|uniref:Uncharacterized protein n=1 Tax=Eruca vesicaria subsp. sativa TaxID=29727 RepID=A0ABC8KXZ2_ERUVS|nr:unnamed protein product [Eruca vesicaria subsp. sativa]
MAGDVVVGAQTNTNRKTTIHETDTDTTMLSKMMNDHHEYNKHDITYKVNHIDLITRPDHNYAMHDVISRTATIETRDNAPIMVQNVRRSLMESVNQVCDDDVASGQRRECHKSVDCYGGGSGRRHIRRGSTNSLPLDACRRRLVF